MPVLAERKKMTKEKLKALIPYILEVRRREKERELNLLQQIACFDDDAQKEKAEEQHSKRIQEIEATKEKHQIVQKTIKEQELNLFNLQKEKHEMVLKLKKSLQMKHKQQIQQQLQQKNE